MSQHGPIYPIAGLSIAEMSPFHEGLRSARSGDRPTLFKTGVKMGALSQSGIAVRAERLAPFPVKGQPTDIPPSAIKPESDHAIPFALLSDDELIAELLICTWTLTTCKTLRRDVPLHELTEEELIDFWSYEYFD